MPTQPFKKPSQFVFKTLDRFSSKLFDICHVLILDLNEALTPTPCHTDFEYRFLSRDEIARFSEDVETDLGKSMNGNLEEDISFRCFAALDDDKLVGYAWIADEDVPPEHNRGGTQFQGFGLELPSNSSFLFKCFVVPEYRGQGVNKHLLWHIAQILNDEGKSRIVTTTGWVNHAFQSSSQKIGFRKVGSAAEWKLVGKHFYRWPELEGVTFYQPSTRI